jgi:hypothetical protein
MNQEEQYTVIRVGNTLYNLKTPVGRKQLCEAIARLEDKAKGYENVLKALQALLKESE